VPANEAIPVELRHAVAPVDTDVPTHPANVPRVDAPEDLLAALLDMRIEQTNFKDPPEMLLPALQGMSRFELYGALGYVLAKGVTEHRDREHYHPEYAQEYRTRWERV
jgi:hypothetical protein